MNGDIWPAVEEAIFPRPFKQLIIQSSIENQATPKKNVSYESKLKNISRSFYITVLNVFRIELD